jgi:hypothetical protein
MSHIGELFFATTEVLCLLTEGRSVRGDQAR